MRNTTLMAVRFNWISLAFRLNKMRKDNKLDMIKLVM